MLYAFVTPREVNEVENNAATSVYLLGREVERGLCGAGPGLFVGLRGNVPPIGRVLNAKSQKLLRRM